MESPSQRWSIPGRGAALPALDGLRAVAVVPVLLVHLELLPGGFLGVTVFFTLSGFLIASILIAEHDRTGRLSLPRFYLRRLARLYPALLVALVLATGVALLTRHNWHWIRNAIGLSGTYSINLWTASRGDFFEIVGHMWSLAQEEQFYLVAPVLLLVSLRLGLRRALVAGCLALAVVLIAVRTALMATHPEQLARIYESPVLNADGMLVGVALALAVATPGAHQSMLRRLTARPVVVVAVLAMLTAFAVSALRDWRQGPGIAVVAAASVVVILRVAGGDRDLLTDVLASRPARWIGRRSYGIYLFHYPLVAAARWLARGTGAALLAEVVALLVAVALAAASSRWIESPVLAATRRLLDRPRRSGDAAIDPLPMPSGVVPSDVRLVAVAD